MGRKRKIAIWVFVSLTGLLFIMYIAFRSSWVQTILVQKITSELNEDIEENISLSGIDFRFFDHLILEDVLILDAKADTMLYINDLSCSFDQFSIKKNHFVINELELRSGLIRLVKQDSSNFTNLEKFLMNFKSAKDTSEPKLIIKPENIGLEKIRIIYEDRSIKLIQDIGEIKAVFKHLDIQRKNIVIVSLKISEPDTKLFTKEETKKDTSKGIFFPKLDFNLYIDNLSLDKGKVDINGRSFKYALNAEGVLCDSDSIKFDIDALNINDADFKDVSLNEAYLKWYEDALYIGGLVIEGKNKLRFYDELKLIDEEKDFLKGEHFGKLSSRFNLNNIAAINALFETVDYTLDLEAYFDGPLDFFNLNKLKINTEYGGEVKMSLGLRGNFLDNEDVFIRAYLDTLNLTQKDIEVWEGDFNLPGGVFRMGQLKANGAIIGFVDDFVASLSLDCELGGVSADLQLQLGQGESNAFNGEIELLDFDVGRFLNVDIISKSKASLRINGKGNSIDNIFAELNATASYLDINQYSAKNWVVSGTFKDHFFDGALSVVDKALDLSFNGKIDLNKEAYQYSFISHLKHIDFTKLGLYEKPLITSGFVNMDFSASTIDDLIGTANLNNIIFNDGKKSHEIPELELVSDIYSGYRYFGLRSDIFDFIAEGDFLWYEIPDILGSYFSKRYPLFFEHKEKELYSSYWDIQASVKNLNPLMEVLDIPLNISQKSSIYSNWYSKNDSVYLKLDLPFLAYDKLSINNVNASFNMLGEKVIFDGSIQKLGFGNLLGVDQIELSIDQDGDVMQLVLNVDRQDSVNYFGLDASTYWKEKKGEVKFNKLNLQVHGQDWLWSGGKMHFDLDGIYLEPQKLRNGAQVLAMSGKFTKDRNDMFRLMFGNISMSDIYSSLEGDDSALSGIMNGVIKLRSALAKPELMLKGKFDELYFFGKEFGDLDFNVSNEGHKEVIDISVKGDPKRTDLLINGNIYNYDSISVLARLNNFEIRKIEALFGEHISEVNGKIGLSIDLNGSITDPDINGSVLFDSIKTKVNYLGVEIMAHDSLKFDQDQFKFENFKVFDAKRTQAYINGRIEHDLFTDFKFDSLRLNPKGEFFILNTTEEDNALYYGKGVIREKMKNLETLAGIIVDGPLNEPYLDFKASSNEGTQIVIPISEEEDFSDQSFVRFKKEKTLNPESDSLGSKRKTSVIFNGDLEINEKSELEIQLGVPDGDIIKVNGRGNLQLDYNETQDFNIYGNYEIESGEYIFNFQDIVKKKFSLVEGSIISWTGDPYAGTMNLKASYRIRTNIASLLQETSFQAEELNLVRSTVLVIMNMKGSLMSPDIKFSIVIDEPQYASLVNPVIKRIESDEQELNKQVFSLLILNRFANLFNKSTISAKTSPLYNNLSEFLSTQLQELVSSSGSEFLSSVDLGVELASYEQGGVDANDEYSAQKQRELKLAISKKLLNDRVIIDIGGNLYLAEEEQNNLAGDFSIEYLITKDGRIRVRLFNQSVNSDIIQEKNKYKTGVSLSYKREYDKLIDLFSKRDQ